jgi:membrane-associated protein
MLALLDAINPDHLLETFGTIGLIVIVFAESGLLIGFFLPGDSLLFAAGLLASQGELNIGVVLVGCFVAAVLGDQVGYMTGRRFGPALFRRPDSKLFRREHVTKAEEFFAHHGPKTILLARFVPVVRTFAPIVAGVSSMPYRVFVVWNVIGGLVWAVGVTTLGYVLGSTFPWIEDYLLPTLLVVVALSLLPVWLEIRKSRRASAARSASSEDAASPSVVEPDAADA